MNDASPHVPPVPIARELRAVHADMLAELQPMTVDRLAALRAEDATEVMSAEELGHGGRFTVTATDRLLICTPVGVPGPRPAIFHVHGGGLFSGDHRVGLGALLDMADRFGATLLSVAYRLAPEHPHPAPIDDVHAGLLWTVEHADELGIDPARIVAAGTSAGGALTAALALRLRDEAGPRLLGQLLMMPMLDDRNDSRSVRQMDGVDIWDSGWNGFGWTALLGDARGARDVAASAAPARATDLSGLPPAFIDVGSAESLRDEAIAYANRIWQAGGEAELHVWSGGFHVFDWAAPDARLSQSAAAARTTWLDRLLTGA